MHISKRGTCVYFCHIPHTNTYFGRNTLLQTCFCNITMLCFLCVCFVDNHAASVLSRSKPRTFVLTKATHMNNNIPSHSLVWFIVFISCLVLQLSMVNWDTSVILFSVCFVSLLFNRTRLLSPLDVISMTMFICLY